MRFDDILEEVNGLGPFQIALVVLFCVPRVVLPCHFLLNNFIAALPPHRCDFSWLDGGGRFRNLTQEQRLTVSIPVRENGGPDACEMFAVPQVQLLADVSNSTGLPTVPCQSGWIYDNSSFTSSIAMEWDLVCERKSLAKMTATVFFLGVMLGAIVFGYLSDKFGRKSTLLLSYVLATAIAFASAFANSYILFSVLRFFTGLSLTGISLISIVLCVEWVDTPHRAFMGVIGSLSWAFGNMLLAVFAYLVNDWRMLILTVTSPLGLAILTWWWIPESARWLLAKGRVERAQFYLSKCAKFNKRQASSRFKSEVLSNVKFQNMQDKNYSYLDLIKTPELRKRTLLTGIVWYGVALTYYGISMNISGFGLNMYLTQFIYAAIEVPAKLMVYFLLRVIGRKTCQAGTLLLTGTCIAVNIFLSKDLWHLRYVVAIIGKGFSEAAFTTVFLYTTELYPTVIRSAIAIRYVKKNWPANMAQEHLMTFSYGLIRQNALGYNNFMSRLGVSMAPLVLLLEDLWTLLPQIIICSVAILCGISCLLLPETRNASLPESISDIERPRRNSGSANPAETSSALMDLKEKKDANSEENDHS